MKRRIFLRITSLSSLVVLIPFFNCETRFYSNYKDLITPVTLSELINDEDIKSIGINYLNKSSIESKKEILEKLNFDDQKLNNQNGVSIKNKIKKRIKIEYMNNETIILQGWILSITEARQCALFYLNN